MGNTWKNILEHGKAAAGVVADKTSEVVDAAGKKAVQLKEEASIESQGIQSKKSLMKFSKISPIFYN